MALVRFKDLCIDASDPTALAAFWAPALGLEAHPLDDGDTVLRGSVPEQTVWVNRVPEPRTVKQRVHLDVHARSVAEVEGFGGRVLPGWGPAPWTVMGDPEGGELSAFVRDDAWWAARTDSYRLYEVGVDAADDRAIAAWWSEVLGGERHDDVAGEFTGVSVPGAPFEALVFAAVPEPKTVKNRIHWDVTGGPEALDALVRRGTRVLQEPTGAMTWTVLADPEGNEFCLFSDET